MAAGVGGVVMHYVIAEVAFTGAAISGYAAWYSWKLGRDIKRWYGK